MTTLQLRASDGNVFPAYLVKPEGTARGAVVVIQEIFGVNSHIRRVTEQYAAQGYLAIAPALFDRVERGYDTGYGPADRQTGIDIIQKKINLDDTMKDVAAALQSVASAGKVGIVGYCWGGRVSWLSAAKVGGLACAISYYGGGIPGLADLQPKCPVLFHWGETDQSLPLDQVKAFAAKHSGETHYFYPAGHGFNCDQRESYDAASAKLARTRSLEFLRKHVG